MSMLLMVKAMNTKVGNPLRKLVLIKLADNANDRGECWPSHQHIADQCEISKRSVINHIKALEKMGLLVIENRVYNNEKKSNIYHLKLDSGSAGDALGSAGDALGGSAGDAHRTSHSFEPVNEPTPNPKGSGGGSEKIPAKAIHDLYNSLCPDLPRSMAMTPKRERQIKARWKEDSSRQNIGWWEGFFKYVHNVPFLNGNNDRGWKADLEWITNPNNFVKVAEGKYQHD